MTTESKSRTSFQQLQLLALLAAIPFFGWGCSGLNPAKMAPKPPAQAPTKIGSSVRVMDVTGGVKSQFGGAEMINSDQFKKALILALQNSGLFTEVSTTKGDYDLFATIRSEDQKVSRGLQYTATMVVSYKVVDRNGQTVWSASYDSESSSTAFSGAARTVEAREGSARENLASFIQGIKEKWPKK